jgi:S1-C subfamily serine protease
MKLIVRVVLLIMLSYFVTSDSWAKKDVKNSVVKIYTVYNTYDYDRPWQMKGQNSCSGSGTIIDGKRILTNAHVVADHTFIQVRKAGDAKRYTAEVEVVAHKCDLAILKVNDDSFYENVDPVQIGDLPKVRDRVAVYGFPEGGDELSITEGVVSRVEHNLYSHSFAHLLTCQIDAAINEGNSGGPVMKDDQLVGVAFQAMSREDVENIGYMVPSPVIKHFLTDIADGKYDGIPELGISTQEMENPDIRLKFGMSKEDTGALISYIDPDSPARGVLRSGDVILAIDGVRVENDKTVEFREGERTHLKYLIQKKQMNDSIRLRILRQKKIMNVAVKLSTPLHSSRLVPHEQYDVSPTYYILGGMLFEPVTLNYLKTWGKKWIFSAPDDITHYYLYGKRTDDRKQVIVLVEVLADEINVGYHDLDNRVVSYVNGKKISTMADLVAAFENNAGKYHIILDERGHQIVLDRSKVDQNSERILERYRITADRSKDLQNVPNKMSQKQVFDPINTVVQKGRKN